MHMSIKKTGKLRLDGPSKPITAVLISPDCRRLLAATSDGDLTISSLVPSSFASTVAVLLGHTDAVNAVAWSGDVIASASSDGSLRTWDAAAGSALATMVGHADGVTAAFWFFESSILVFESGI